ncbi:MAG: hypothetical protein ACN6OP_08465, partial [Pseudomonadales bacterium]
RRLPVRVCPAPDKDEGAGAPRRHGAGDGVRQLSGIVPTLPQIGVSLTVLERCLVVRAMTRPA